MLKFCKVTRFVCINRTDWKFKNLHTLITKGRNSERGYKDSEICLCFFLGKKRDLSSTTVFPLVQSKCLCFNLSDVYNVKVCAPVRPVTFTNDYVVLLFFVVCQPGDT